MTTSSEKFLGERTMQVVVLVLLSYGLLGCMTGPLRLLGDAGPLVSDWSWQLSLMAGAVVWMFSRHRSQLPLAAQVGCALIVCLPLASNFIERKFVYLNGIQEMYSLLLLAVIAALLQLFVSARSEQPAELTQPITLLIATQALIAGVFISYADGRLLFSDDHPSFLYRLQLLMDEFPSIPFYNTEWNAGYSAREFFPSGVLNVFFLSAPILYFFGDIRIIEHASVYTILIPYLYIGIIPLSIFFAGRLLRLSALAAVAAGLFSLAPSLAYFEWLLKYGTLGYCLSAGLFPLTFALAYRVGIEEEPHVAHLFFLLLVASLCLMWTLTGFAFLPLVLMSLWLLLRSPSKKRLMPILLFAAAFFLLNGTWIVTFLIESKVFSFLEGSTLPGSGTRSITQATGASHSESFLEHVRASLVKLHPALFILALPGLFLIRERLLRIALGLTMLWLLFVASVGEDFKPQLELRRMFLLYAFLATLVVGNFLAVMFERVFSLRSKVLRVLALLPPMLLFLSGPYAAALAYSNRSDERFVFAPDEVWELTRAIAEHGGSGRVFFVGFILQELGAANYASQDGGHIAPLTTFSGKPLYASDFYHRRWSVVDPIPNSFRSRGEEGIEEFLDLVNATAVVTFKSEWRDYCQARQNLYQEVGKFGRFRLFKRTKYAGDYFLEGSGTLEVSRTALKLIAQTPEVVLKFRYLPSLRLSGASSGAAELEAEFQFHEEVGGGKTEPVSFVALKKLEPGFTYTISY